ncbi:t-SNARE coiled-coil domain [Carpediemonas membranifera]|uniref:t-SNARE coiled-coil domain n=1 Tax=Carpediemonas membranifera TaxID=201153 RepID=A0A8J6E0J1_9EUKA|nr:t-SNARE coiled-coil domain [Carpediemonas membranifera]|eukprot:KAG9392303.1 t-SNARE coiled-coil domain [Carpediemonas membranifera]
MAKLTAEAWEEKYNQLIAYKDQMGELKRTNAKLKFDAASGRADALYKEMKRDISTFRSNMTMYRLTSTQVTGMTKKLEDVRRTILHITGTTTKPTGPARQRKSTYEETEQSRGMDNASMLSYQQDELKGLDTHLDALHDTVRTIRMTSEDIGDELDRGDDIIDETSSLMTKQTGKLGKATKRIKKTRRITKGGLSLICLNACVFLLLIIIFLSALFIPSGWPVNH